MSYDQQNGLPVVTHEIIEAGMRRASRERSLAFYAAMGVIRAAFAWPFARRDHKSRIADTGHLAIGRACQQVL